MASSKATGRYSASLCLKNRDTSRLFDDKTTTTRPRSAISERRSLNGRTSQLGGRRIQSATVYRTKHKQHARCNQLKSQISEELPFSNSASLPETSSQVTIYKPKDVANAANDNSKDEVTRELPSRTLPSSLGPLTELVHLDLNGSILGHAALSGSLVILPCLEIGDSQSLPELPSSPPSNDEPYPYTHTLPAEYIHKPKKHSHPYYDRIKSIKGWVCNHTNREIRVGATTGETIHRFKVNGQRSKAEVRQEIEELERLMKGLSTDWGTASVVLYQNEINSLQQMVKDTLALTSCPDTPPGTPDPTGLRKFCKEYDTALQALQDRHQQCMLELNQLEEYEYLLSRSNQLLKVTSK